MKRNEINFYIKFSIIKLYLTHLFYKIVFFEINS